MTETIDFFFFFKFSFFFFCNQKNGIYVLQEYGEIEAEFAKVGTERVLLEMLTYRNTGPILLPKGKSYDDPVSLPSWLTEYDVKYYVSKYEKSGFTGPVNYYRNMDRYETCLYIKLGSISLISPARFFSFFLV